MYDITIQYAAAQQHAPAASHLEQWAKAALSEQCDAAELTIRIVDVTEITALNSTYRHKNKATNVLSFPFDAPEGIAETEAYLGDIIICADVVNEEAKAQHKATEAHWAHMVVHGVFHLLGYDHEQEDEATEMESLEINVLKQLGFANPYEHDNREHDE